MQRQAKILIFLISVFFAIASAYAGEGVISLKSPRGVDATADRLENILKEKGLTIFKRIDHGKNAKKAGLTLRPTKLFIFGNPKIGGQLMLCNQEAAIDLPMKALIWQVGAGKVWFSYNDLKFISGRFEMEKDRCAKVIPKMENALRNIAHEAIAP